MASWRDVDTVVLCTTSKSDARSTCYRIFQFISLMTLYRFVKFLNNTNPILNDFSPALNIPSGKVSEFLRVKYLLSKIVVVFDFLHNGVVLFWIRREHLHVGFPAVSSCVFSGRTQTESGGQTFGACLSKNCVHNLSKINELTIFECCNVDNLTQMIETKFRNCWFAWTWR